MGAKKAFVCVVLYVLNESKCVACDSVTCALMLMLFVCVYGHVFVCGRGPFFLAI